VFINIEPLMGACVGVLLFGDHLTAALAAGGLMIIAGSFAVVLGEKKAALGDGCAAPTSTGETRSL
jgi:drug/metabolite transporter (DMT)-like permease